MRAQDDPRVRAWFQCHEALEGALDFKYDTTEYAALMGAAQVYATLACVPADVIMGSAEVRAARKAAQDAAHSRIADALSRSH